MALAQAAELGVTEPLQVPYLPAALWALVTGMSLVLVLVALGIYLWYRSRIEAVVEDASTAADLAAKKVQLEAEIEQCRSWLKDNREELLKLDAERQHQEVLRQELARLSMELAQNEQKMDELRREASDLQSVVSTLAQDRDRLVAEKAALDSEKGECEAAKRAAEEARHRADTEAKQAEQALRSLVERWGEEKERLDRIVQDVIEKEVKQQSLGHELTTLTEKCSAWQEELLKLEAERQKQENLRKELEDLQRALAQHEQKVSDLRREASDLQHTVSTLARDRERVANEKAVLDEKRAEAEESRQRAVAAAKQAQEEMQSLIESRREENRRHDDILRDIADKEIKRQSLMHEITVLKGQLSDLQQDNTATDRYADLLETPPECLSDNVFPDGRIVQRDEEEALFELQQSLKAEGLLFSERILKAFHTSLKVSQISPLTVLAGVSGTGKSILPIMYAKAMGIHSLIVSVQPRWDSPQDLFGFYNYLEHKYKATDLARALIRLDNYNFNPNDFPFLEGQKRNERMLLVLLDEMNLARIEYYFSEFLSKLEIRRLVMNPDQQERRAFAEFELETGPRSTENGTFRLWVGENVLFVGTMNEDESTQTLSDKVLDRANVLRFGRPPEGVFAERDNDRDNACSNGKFLTLSEWESWIRHLSPGGNPWDSEVKRWLTSVNNALGRIGRPFGYRVQQGIREYILNYPGVQGGQIYKTAFADQLEQKVLPKLRGMDMFENASMEALNEIYNVLEDLGDEDLLKSFQASRDDQSSGTFLWRGVTRAV